MNFHAPPEPDETGWETLDQFNPCMLGLKADAQGFWAWHTFVDRATLGLDYRVFDMAHI